VGQYWQDGKNLSDQTMTLKTETPSQVVSDPEQFARVFLRILDKDKKLVPLWWNKTQRDFHSKRTGKDLILKARQLGVSTYVQAEMFRRTVTSTRATITLAHDDNTTQILRRMADRFYDHCKFNNIQPVRKYANAALATYPEFDSEAIIAKAGSKEVGRGGTYTDFHGSECAFWPDAEKLIAGAMQGGDPDVILESTPNGAQGWFYERCMEALDGDDTWKLHFYPWWWDDNYQIPLKTGESLVYTDEELELVKKHRLTAQQIKWRRSKQTELRALFVQEYPEDPILCFLTSGNSYFGDVENIYTAPLDVEYNPDHRYAGGLDWGQENDFTDMLILDMNNRCMVDKLHVRKLAWGEIRHRVKTVYDKWHLRGLVAEANSIGSVNIEELRKLGVTVIPFETTNESKSMIMGELYEALHSGWQLQDWDVLKQEIRIFVSTKLPSGLWRLAAAGDGHDDAVIALALAYYAVEAAQPVILFGA